MYLKKETSSLEERIEKLEDDNRRIVDACKKELDCIVALNDSMEDYEFNFEKLKDSFLDLLNKEGYIIDIIPAVPAKDEQVVVRKIKKQKTSKGKKKKK